MRIGVTGSSGYVGRSLVGHFRGQGHKVLELRRLGPGEIACNELRPFSLSGTVDSSVFQGLDAVVHCAYDMRATRWREIEEVNVCGSKSLLNAARQAGVSRLILMSSISAFSGAVSLYGRAKLLIEDEFYSSGGLVVRPGLVFGDSPGGMVGTLRKITSTLPIVPVPGVSQQMFLVHELDLAALIDVLIAKGTAQSGPFFACHETPVPFGAVLRELAARHGKSPWLMPIPWRLPWLALRTLEVLNIRLGVRSDSLVSMMNPLPAPDFSLTRSLSCSFRPFIQAGE